MQNIHKFEKELKIKFKNKSLLEKALTHKSTNQEINNEKLEFVGDRVIALIFARKLEKKIKNDLKKYGSKANDLLDSVEFILKRKF